MLSIVFKIISKLLVVGLIPYSKDLINPQQTGFIHVHFILENVSLAWLTYNSVIRHKKPTLFLKLDFKKELDMLNTLTSW